MLYPRHMPSDPPSAGAEWHSSLASRDEASHQRMADVADAGEVALLRRRIDGMSAELTVLRAAVDRRSRLLHEQGLALQERDARLRLLESSAPRQRKVAGALRSVVRKGRTVAGRLVRAGLRQR